MERKVPKYESFRLILDPKPCVKSLEIFRLLIAQKKLGPATGHWNPKNTLVSTYTASAL